MRNPDRYDRQRRFALVGESGQRRLLESHVAVLGCGALGTVAAEILARAGVGRLHLIDRDTVELTNLQRQSLFNEADAEAGRAKVDAATERLRAINSQIVIEPHLVDVRADNIAALLSGADLVIDGTDNFGVRFLLNDYSLETKTPWVHGGCVGATGQVAFFTGRGSPCFRCLIPSPPDPSTVQTCDTAGVIGAATHTIASLQAMRAIRFLSHDSAVGEQDEATSADASEVLSLDMWRNRIRTLNIADDNCPACKQGKRDFLHGTMSAVADQSAVLCGRNAVQIHPQGNSPNHRIDFDRMQKAWLNIGSLDRNAFFIRLHLPQDQSLTLFRDGRAVVGGTEDLAIARSIYAKYVGG
ncbi:Molybdopterin-synthase adenylyltransferase [Roseimaritima multifibrata]|uniref:Molybdopterin-synthase adenylyltransferase n=1 Tax=Roseimaritima multifibrata TaxID=1930274 RepID=A0A517MDG5_9BACT|nr:ThiF family adenylyltransferase [Roseimaritima multifibrata]QDS92925.1 Molybdopterin-synthase adenylyltransferase [Roseimaritima multifibrata]